jgi:hypothetical protein
MGRFSDNDGVFKPFAAVHSKTRRLLGRAAAFALAILAAKSSAMAQVTGTVTGSVSANFSSSTDNDTTTYSLVNVSGSLNVDLPTIPATANTGTWSWNDPLAWGSSGIVLLDTSAVKVGEYLAGIPDDIFGSILDIPNQAQTLENSGPTEGSIGWTWGASYAGVSFNVGAAANTSYDVYLPTGTNMSMSQQSVIVHSLFIYPGATLTSNTFMSNPTFTVRTNLDNQGSLLDLSGTVQGNFTNYANANTDMTGPFSVQGTFSNYGTVSIESSGSLSLSQPSSNNGIIYQYGGSINVPGTFTNNGSFNWYGGSLPTSFENAIMEQMTISGSGGQTIGINATFNNDGMISQTGVSQVTLDGSNFYYNGYNSSPTVLNNAAGAVYDIQGDGGFQWQATGNNGNGSSFSANSTINNNGLFEKTSGTGVSIIGSGVTFNNTGTVEVDSGTLSIQGGGTSVGGSFIVSNGAVIQFDSGYTLAGIHTLTGTGTLEIPTAGSLAADGTQGGTLNAALGSIVLMDGGSINGLVLTGPGSFQWTSGSLSGTVTNNGAVRQSQGNIVINGNTTLDNNNLIGQSGTSQVTLDGSNFYNNYGYNSYPTVLNNAAGAVYNIQGDGGFQWQPTGNNGNGSSFSANSTINNNGLFEKTSGTGVSIIGSGVVFNNTGTVEVDSGTLSIQGGGTSTGGSFIVSNGAVLQFASSYTLSGTNTLTGNGILEVPQGSNLYGASDQSCVLSIANGATVLLDGGTLNDNITLSGSGKTSITGVNTTILAPGAALTNAGTITQMDGATVTLDGSNFYYNGYNSYPTVLNNAAGAVYDIQGDGGFQWQATGNNGNGSSFSANSTINNNGLFEKTSGTGVSIIGSGVTFNNTGTVEVDGGTLQFNQVSQQSGNTLTGGTWNVNGGTLIFSGPNITANQAAIVLNGSAASFPNINSLASNSGSFTISGGMVFTTANDLINSGALNAGADGTLAVNGGLSGNGSTMVCARGTLTTNFIRQNALTVNGIAAVNEATPHDPSASVSAVSLLTIAGTTGAWTGTLDLSNNDLIVYGGSLSTITDQLRSGFNKGDWNGTGIASSAAHDDSNFLTALGVIQQSESETFDGQAVSTGDVLVKYTYYGDANLDGTVNGADYQQIDMGFGLQLTGWSNGDFNYDGVVDGSDYSLLDNTFNQINATSAGSLALIACPADLTPSSVPEPTTLVLLGLGTIGQLRRRPRRSIRASRITGRCSETARVAR